MKTIVKHRFLTKPLVGILGLSFLIPFTAAEARIKFNAPPDLGVPGRRVPGGARTQDNKCFTQDKSVLTALVPKSNKGVKTTSANPTLFFYVPQTSKSLELVMRDENKQEFKQTYEGNPKAGIVGIPWTKTSLKVNQSYRWYFAIVCSPKERSKDQVVDGAIKRVQLEPSVMAKLKNPTAQERATIYAEAGIWQDSLTTLAQLLSNNRDNAALKADWRALLVAEDLNDVSVAPLVSSR
jgi:Domain of Unknown Function (DUF928)